MSKRHARIAGGVGMPADGAIGKIGKKICDTLLPIFTIPKEGKLPSVEIMNPDGIRFRNRTAGGVGQLVIASSLPSTSHVYIPRAFTIGKNAHSSTYSLLHDSLRQYFNRYWQS